MHIHSIREKREFRQWIHVTKNTTIHHSWALFPKSFGITLGLADYECAVSIFVRIFIASFYFSINNWKLEKWIQEKTKRKDTKYGDGREIGIRVFDWKVWIDLWSDPMEWRSEDPWWYQFTIDPIELILGCEKVNHEVIDQGESAIVMPEGEYQCTFEIREYRHKRKRWIARTRYSISVDIKDGIPIEGKGESSWDCGMDAIYGTSMAFKQGDHPYKYMNEIALSIIKDRLRRGNLSGYSYMCHK